MRCLRVRSGQLGFSLVELLIAIGIGALTLVTATELMVLSSQVHTNTQRSMDLFSLRDELQRLFIAENVCRNMLTGNGTVNVAANALPGPMPLRLYTYSAPPSVAAGAIFLDGLNPVTYGSLRITSATYQEVNRVPGVSSEQTISIGQLTISALRPGFGPGAGAFQMSIWLPISMVIENATQLIRSCSLVNPDTQRPIPLPSCVPGQYLIYNGTQWACQTRG